MTEHARDALKTRPLLAGLAAALATGMAGILAGCGTAGGPSALSLPTLTADAPANSGSPPAATGSNSTSNVEKPSIFASMAPPVGPPTEVYTRVARGVLTCWFGANGPLKPHYIYHAEADPPSKGGASVIDIHARDKSASDPRSIRAWKVAMTPTAEGTALSIENFRLPEDQANRLESDVRRWAAAQEGCGEGPVVGGWAANPAAPVVESRTKAKPR